MTEIKTAIAEYSQTAAALAVLRDKYARPFDASTAKGMIEAREARAKEETERKEREAEAERRRQAEKAEAHRKRAQLEADIAAVADPLSRLEQRVLHDFMGLYDALAEAYQLGRDDTLSKAA